MYTASVLDGRYRHLFSIVLQSRAQRFALRQLTPRFVPDIDIQHPHRLCIACTNRIPGPSFSNKHSRIREAPGAQVVLRRRWITRARKCTPRIDDVLAERDIVLISRDPSLTDCCSKDSIQLTRMALVKGQRRVTKGMRRSNRGFAGRRVGAVSCNLKCAIELVCVDLLENFVLGCDMGSALGEATEDAVRGDARGQIEQVLRRESIVRDLKDGGIADDSGGRQIGRAVDSGEVE